MVAFRIICLVLLLFLPLLNGWKGPLQWSPLISIHKSSLKLHISSKKTFHGITLPSYVVESLEKQGVKKLSPIQEASIIPLSLGIPASLIHAPTGSGKTLAYLLPVLSKLLKENDVETPSESVRVAILAPTPLLACQISKVAVELLQLKPQTTHSSSTPQNNSELESKTKHFSSDDEIHDESIHSQDPSEIIASLALPELNKKLLLDSLESGDLTIEDILEFHSAINKAEVDSEEESHETSIDILSDNKPVVELLFSRSERAQFADSPKVWKQSNNTSSNEQYIWIGTPEAFQERLKWEDKERLKQLSVIILDEVDVLFPLCGKRDSRHGTIQHGPLAWKRSLLAARKSMITNVLQLLRQSTTKAKKFKSQRPIQFIGVSATVGRPLRRYLIQLLNLRSLMNKSNNQEQLDEENDFTISTTLMDDLLPVIRSKDEIQPQSHGEVNTRKVNIPPNIHHKIEIVNRQGFEKHRPPTLIEQSAAIQRHIDNLSSKSCPLIIAVVDQKAALPALKRSLRLPSNIQVFDLAELIQRTALPRPTVVLATIDGLRGIHLNDVDEVLLLSPSRDMDAYIHAAGRTGRLSIKPSQVRPKVVSLSSPSEATRMLSWEKALGVSFDINQLSSI